MWNWYPHKVLEDYSPFEIAAMNHIILGENDFKK
jgi:hypothetical protein